MDISNNHEVIRNCPKHGKTLHIIYPKRIRCRKCQVAANKKTRQNWKLKAIKYKGGKCDRCLQTFKDYPSVYEFHHTNPSLKEFIIGRGTSWKVIKTELDKCIMLCANCHRIVHEELKKNNSRVGSNPTLTSKEI